MWRTECRSFSEVHKEFFSSEEEVPLLRNVFLLFCFLFLFHLLFWPPPLHRLRLFLTSLLSIKVPSSSWPDSSSRSSRLVFVLSEFEIDIESNLWIQLGEGGGNQRRASAEPFTYANQRVKLIEEIFKRRKEKKNKRKKTKKKNTQARENWTIDIEMIIVEELMRESASFFFFLISTHIFLPSFLSFIFHSRSSYELRASHNIHSPLPPSLRFLIICLPSLKDS